MYFLHILHIPAYRDDEIHQYFEFDELDEEYFDGTGDDEDDDMEW